MKIKYYIYSVLFLFSNQITTYAQGWEKTYSEGNFTIAADVLSTIDGGYVSLGRYSLPTGAPRDYMRLIKVDGAGELQWENIPFLGEIRLDEPKELAHAPDNGFYALGTTLGYEDNDMLLIRFNALGDTLWTKQFNYNGLSTSARAMNNTINGGLIISGHFVNHQDTMQGIYLIETDADGNINWEQSYGWDEDDNFPSLESIIPISGGGYMAVGKLYNHSAAFIIRFDEQGAIVWSQDYGLTQWDGFWDIVETPNGEFISCGYGSGIAGEFPQVIRIDEDGNSIWQQIYPYNYTRSTNMVAAPNGGYVMTGSLDENLWYPTAHTGFLLKINEAGEEEWYQSLENSQQGSSRLGSIANTLDGGYIAAGELGFQHYLVKTDGDGNIHTNQIKGSAFFDEDDDCLQGNSETPLNGWIVKVENSSTTYFTTTDTTGYYEITVDTGSYNVSITLPNNNWSACEIDQTAILSTFHDTAQINFAVQAIIDCPAMVVDIGVPFLRRCFDNIYTVHYCNEGTITAENAYVDITLDPYLSIVEADLPYEELSNGIYQFDLADVPANTCESFHFTAYLDCDNTVLGQTHCVEAHLYPDTLCGSSNALQAIIDLNAECIGDSVIFTIKNIGDADMENTGFFIVIEDDVMYAPMPYDLDIGEEFKVVKAANGSTYRLETERLPSNFAPGFISRTVEGCGSEDFSIGFVNQFPLYPGGPSEDIDCQENIGAYDPNDKRGFPIGYSDMHYIKPGTDLDYHIRFQNTGTDTAFNVVIRDTLSPLLDPSTIKVGASSHAYTWALSSEDVLSFTFSDIMLADSNINEPASHGFIRFSISPKQAQEIGDRIENWAAIYFDFNAPVITNTSFHIVNVDFVEIVNIDGPTSGPAKIIISAFPNPTKDWVNLEVQGLPITEGTFNLYDVSGRLVIQEKIDQPQFTINLDHLAAGAHYFQLMVNGRQVGSGELIIAR